MVYWLTKFAVQYRANFNQKDLKLLPAQTTLAYAGVVATATSNALHYNVHYIVNAILCF